MRDKEFLLREYVENGKSARQIALEVGCSHQTVSKYLKEFGIPIRQSKPVRTGQVPFGKRLVKSKELEHKRELEVLAKIKELRSRGFSYWKIAEILDTMGIPTKTRRAGWKAATVMKILKRNEET